MSSLFVALTHYNWVLFPLMLSQARANSKAPIPDAIGQKAQFNSVQLDNTSLIPKRNWES